VANPTLPLPGFEPGVRTRKNRQLRSEAYRERERQRDRERIRPAGTCPICGEQYHPSSGNGRQKTCSRKCAGIMQRERTLAERPASSRIYPTQCQQCGKTWIARRAEARWCSKACYRQGTKPHRVLVKQRSSLGLEQGECGWCGKRIAHLGFCSTQCRNWLYKYNTWLIQGRERFTKIAYSECRGCGKTFPHRLTGRHGGGGPGFCSDRCAINAAQRRRMHEIRSGCRQSDAFTLREIAERDGWRCHICHRKVKDRPYLGKPGDPTIDHLVPLSAGGLHVRTNVALAHMLCNSRRNAAGTAQLRLIG
jgi:predicted nucleic acid-binding Zn ribbon protein